MKKIYQKPEIEKITFYSDEEIASVSAEDEDISGDMATVNFNELGFDWT